jgi:integrase
MLTDAKLRTLKPRSTQYRLADEGGLLIQVQTTGTRVWRMVFRFEKKQRMLSGGKYPAVGLAAAREWRDKIKDILSRGEDPHVVLQAEKEAQAEHSFEAAATGWLSTQTTWGERYKQRVKNRLVADVYPCFGSKHVAEITEADVIAMIKKVESRGVIETAHRIRGYVSDTFKYAKAHGWSSHNPTIDVKDVQKKKPKVRNRAKVMPDHMGSFLAKVRADDGEEMTKLALWFTILTAARTDETRFAEISEFTRLDGKDPMWRLSPDRMKMEHEHLVGLSTQAVAIVKRLRELNPHSSHLFPVHYSKSGVISENRMLDLMYRLGLRRVATVHGFRGTFSTWANESLKYHPDVIEMALSHRVPAASSRGSYNSALYLDARRTLLQDWANWLDEQEEIAELLG